MLTLIKKLQKKPEHVRRRIVIAIAGTVTFIFFIVWVLSFSASLKSTEVSEETVFSTAPISSVVNTLQRQTELFVERFEELFQYTATSSNAVPIVVE